MSATATSSGTAAKTVAAFAGPLQKASVPYAESTGESKEKRKSAREGNGMSQAARPSASAIPA